MKATPYPTALWHNEPPSKYQKTGTSSTSSFSSSASSTLKMKTSTTKNRKRPSPKHTPLPPLPSISTLFESGASSHSSSSNSSYGSYCQFSPEGSYTMYHYPMNYIPYEAPAPSTSTAAATNTVDPMMIHSPAMSADEHKPVNQPLFIQTADYPYDYTATDSTGGYPSSATINASQLLLRPVPNGR